MADYGEAGNDLMADQSDVEFTLVNLASGALYPNGTTQPSIPGPDCRIYRGWPNSAALDSDLSAGKINVTVVPAGDGHATTRFSDQWSQSVHRPTLTATVTGNAVTFEGSANAGQIAGILVNGKSYAYRTCAGDTPQLVAANLAALIRADLIADLSGGTVVIAGARDLLARVVADATALQEVRRQEQTFRITCWCPTPTSRDMTASAIDQLLSTSRFIALADGSSGRLVYAGTTVFDQSQNAKLYRRDLSYSVEYPTIVSMAQSTMLFGNSVLNAISTTA